MENKDALFLTFKKESQLGKYNIYESLHNADSETSYIVHKTMMPSLSNYLEVSWIEGKWPHTCTGSPYLPNKHGFWKLNFKGQISCKIKRYLQSVWHQCQNIVYFCLQFFYDRSDLATADLCVWGVGLVDYFFWGGRGRCKRESFEISGPSCSMGGQHYPLDKSLSLSSGQCNNGFPDTYLLASAIYLF